MLLTVKCKGCDRPIDFDPETHALERHIFRGSGETVTEYRVQCPACPSMQWATFVARAARAAPVASS